MWQWITGNQVQFLIGSGVCFVLGIAFYVITELRLHKQKRIEDAEEAAANGGQNDA